MKTLEFSCIYTRVLPATGEVLLVVAKSIQKQIKSIDADKIGSQ